ncbi:MAG: type I pullulanase [Prevotella sp.]|nr:type I pullulanase [Prevotella sp.]
MKKSLIVAMAATAITACQNGSQKEAFCFDEMTYSPTETVFKLFAPADAEVSVVVGTDTIAMVQIATIDAPDSTSLPQGAIWTAALQGDNKGKEYSFVVDGRESPGVFAKAVTVNGRRGVIVDMNDTNPEGWDTDTVGTRHADFAQWVVYELHHRDFSIGRQGAQHPGKFLALTEPWALQHLTALGINAVHLLPSYDFGSIDEEADSVAQYNWGYDPVNYNVPEGSYSTNAADPLCRIREFKQMVMALHKAGINVILDVVYNHTYDIEHSNFQRTFPDYYYRKTASGDYSNGSGCGNETASEHEMMRRFMVESVKYWVREFHIDGFRFDLMGCHDIETMNLIRQEADMIDPTLFIYGEGWSAGQCALPTEQLGVKANTALMPGIAAFSDDLRDALRGPFSDDTKGAFLAALPGSEMSIKAGVAGMVEHPQVDYSEVNYSERPYALQPTQMIAYVSCHDDMCLTDRLVASVPSLSGLDISTMPVNSPKMQELIRLDLLAQTAVFTSQGVPFMLCGEELLRTKKGVHNSFNSPDCINRLDWTATERFPQVLDYYSRLIAMRHNHPAFRLGNDELVRQHLQFLPVDSDCVVAYCLNDHAGGDTWQNIIVVLNASKATQTVSVPQGLYTVVCDNGRIDESGLYTITGQQVEVKPQTAVIMHLVN